MTQKEQAYLAGAFTLLSLMALNMDNSEARALYSDIARHVRNMHGQRTDEAFK